MAIDAKRKHQIIELGSLKVTGRLVDASNATLFGEVEHEGLKVPVIYKPVAGERPLWDFPDGTLAGREIAAYRLSEFAGFGIVPFTILRDGPYGPGAVQEWIEVNPEIDIVELAQSHDERLRNFVLFDAVVNNTDRKMGHLLPGDDGRLMGCDHGVCFHQEDKLRTVLWQWMGAKLTIEEASLLRRFLDNFSDFSSDVAQFITADEIEATRMRAERLLSEGAFPYPSEDWPAVPWPPI